MESKKASREACQRGWLRLYRSDFFLHVMLEAGQSIGKQSREVNLGRAGLASWRRSLSWRQSAWKWCRHAGRIATSSACVPGLAGRYSFPQIMHVCPPPFAVRPCLPDMPCVVHFPFRNASAFQQEIKYSSIIICLLIIPSRCACIFTAQKTHLRTGARGRLGIEIGRILNSRDPAPVDTTQATMEPSEPEDLADKFIRQI